MKGLGSKDPEWLGRNRMVAVIGQGGMGRVLLGQAPSGRLVAVKRIHPHLAGNAEFRARFHREVQASSKVTGAYTAGVVDSDTESPTPWLATEYIPGPSLKTVVEETGPLSLGGLRLLAAGLAAAMMEIHRAGLIHRDLKPANVLLSTDGPRVIDFGIARALEGDAQLTATGSVIGSPAFMSPEQAQGQPLSPAADVFSVGAILTMAATGASPFAGTATPQVLYNVMYNPPDISRVPEPLRDIVGRCLAKHPEQRPTPEELMAAAGQVEAEPVWPGAVREVIATHRTDSEWWAETTAKHAKYQAQLADLQARRKRAVLRSAAAAGAVALLICTGMGARQLALQSGHAAPMTNPPVALTGAEWQLLDACAVVEKAGIATIGQRTGELKTDISGGCTSSFTPTSGEKRSLSLTFTGPASDTLGKWTPTGGSAAWMPIYGLFLDTTGCKRRVVTQNSPRVVLEVAAGGKGAESCKAAEAGILSIANQLAVNPPQLSVPGNSIRRLEPCALLDQPAAAKSLGGTASRYLLQPGTCYLESDKFFMSLELSETSRPDMPDLSGKAPPTTQVDGKTVYLDDGVTKYGQGNCTLKYMVRPTADKKADVVNIMLGSWGDDNATSCDRAEQAMAAVLPQLPK
ncbi:serine/threonine protein kinase [Nocardia yamanashiensis]|uniref:serine/threonine-protein kinase n=1 Tax=Nocardia yamanashiensis TaxID=209247 RepID=UPI001E3727BD|nr:serine/threonine-protein kinase [Nocardia yamanashiensis]UGT39643.1 serine/threonine protein kinase [Nocardia yamanashiensis]